MWGVWGVWEVWGVGEIEYGTINIYHITGFYVQLTGFDIRSQEESRGVGSSQFLNFINRAIIQT